MPSITQQFIAFAKRLREHLDTVDSALGSLKDNVQSIADDYRADRDERKARENEPTPNLPAPTPPNESRSDDAKKQPLDERRFTVEKITLVVLAIYAGLTAWQGCSTHTLVTISQNQQRPYVWAVPRPRNPDGSIFRHIPTEGTSPTGLPNERIAIDIGIELKNGGLSPAVNVIASTPNISETPRQFFNWDFMKGQYLDYPTLGGSVIGVNSSISVPAQTQWVNQESMPPLHGSAEYAFVVGKVRYTDIYHPHDTPYETLYCFILKPESLRPTLGGAVEGDTTETCPFGNTFK